MLVYIALCLACAIQFAFIAVLAHRLELLEKIVQGSIGGRVR